MAIGNLTVEGPAIVAGSYGGSNSTYAILKNGTELWRFVADGRSIERTWTEALVANTLILMCGCRSQGEDSVKKKELATLSLLLIIIGAVAAYVVIENPFAPAGTWEVASEISGTGNQDTTEFNMSSQWRLAWKIENGTANYFIAQVYARNSSDSSGFSLVAESDGSDTNAATGGCPVDFTGSFIIRVIAESDTGWSLQIQELVKPAR